MNKPPHIPSELPSRKSCDTPAGTRPPSRSVEEDRLLARAACRPLLLNVIPSGRASRRLLDGLRSIVPALLLVACAATSMAGPPTLRTIQIDGDTTDWTSVLVNPVQVTRDGDGSRIDCAYSSDLDCPIQSSGRDLRIFAWTYDSIHLFLYAERQGSTSNTETFWFFMDLDDDGLMEAGEKGLRVVYKGSTGSTTSDVYRYTPADPAGDPMVDPFGRADGWTLPGSLGPAAIYSEGAPDGGRAGGSVFEERLPWSVIGVPAGTPIGFHVASSNSQNPGGIATQVDDNLGSLGGGGGSLHHDDVTIAPDRSGFVAPGGTTLYAHDVRNTGTRDASFALRAVSSVGTSVAFHVDVDGDGAPDALVARDLGGDGDFTDAGDSISPGWDRDADGLPDTPVLAPDATFHLVVEVTAGVSLDGRFDSLVVEVFLAGNPEDVAASVTDTTHVGLVIVRFDQDRTSEAGARILHPVQVCNNTIAQTLDLVVASAAAYSVSLFSDASCDGTGDLYLARDDQGDGAWDDVAAGDSDGDGLPDAGVLAAGQCACFVVEVSVPASATVGTIDTTTLSARAMPSGTTSGTATLVTRVSAAIEISPDYLVADLTAKYSGAGTSVFFPHVARANGIAVDRVEFASVPPVNDAGWTVVIWSDPDGDGSIADGEVITRTDPIAPNGGTQSFVVEVRVPELVAPGTQSRTVVTGTSTLSPLSSDTVTDDVVVSVLSTYSDPLFSFQTTAFVPCDTIYVLATGLRRRESHELLYSDGLENPVSFVSPWVADDAGVAEDSYTVQPGDATGTWVIEVRESGVVIGRRTIVLESSARISSLTTDRILYPQVGVDLLVDAVVLNDNLLAPFLNTTLEYLLLDPTGTLYYDLAGGSFRPYSAGDVSRRVDVPRLDPGATFVDRMSAPAVTYPSDGAYCVVARIVAPCGAVLATRAACFTVGAGIEQCGNGIDDDGDGLADCLDPECALDPACREVRCGDGLDDDGDGLVDCDDPDCRFDPACQEICTNGVDDDGDGRVDCLDSDCAALPACTETECSNLVDDDRDGFVDCGDSDCAADPTCLPESPCDDGLDNDRDTATDCADADCVADPACADDDLDDDGVPNGSDCAPLDPGAWSVPAEVTRLDVGDDPSGVAYLSWTDMSLQAGPAVVYDVVTGLVSELWLDRGFARATCLARGRTLAAGADGRRIASAPDAFYYLVRAVNVCGTGSWGRDGEGAERVVAACSP